jgi:hypothetical protein
MKEIALVTLERIKKSPGDRRPPELLSLNAKHRAFLSLGSRQLQGYLST